MRIKILPNERGVPQAKLADVEILFEEEGVFCGLKLVGFAVWEGREGPHVTFPARPFVANGERRLYTLLRPARETAALEPLRELIMQVFAEFQHQAAAHGSATGDSPTTHTDLTRTALTSTAPTNTARADAALTETALKDTAPRNTALNNTALKNTALKNTALKNTVPPDEKPPPEGGAIT